MIALDDTDRRILNLMQRDCALTNQELAERVHVSGPDFVLVVYVADMAAYHAFAHRVLSAHANVRNVRSFFSVRRSKFAPSIPA